MISRHILFGFAALTVVVVVPGVQALAVDTSGRTIGFTCAGCHGTDGKSHGAAPSLQGLPAELIEQSLLDFKYDRRPATIMGRIAKGYSDAEIAAVAQYFAGLN